MRLSPSFVLTGGRPLLRHCQGRRQRRIAASFSQVTALLRYGSPGLFKLFLLDFVNLKFHHNSHGQLLKLKESSIPKSVRLPVASGMSRFGAALELAARSTTMRHRKHVYLFFLKEYSLLKLSCPRLALGIARCKFASSKSDQAGAPLATSPATWQCPASAMRTISTLELRRLNPSIAS